MKYPVSSETFAQRDVQALESKGCVVEKYSLAERMTLRIMLISLVRLFFRKPGLLALCKLALRVVFSPGWAGSEKLKCIALLIPAARIAEQLIESRPDVIHLFWGHYPSLVTLLARPHLSEACFSIFLGAYDLEKKLPISRWASAQSDIAFTHAYVNRAPICSLVGDRHIEVVHRGIDLAGYAQVPKFSDRKYTIFSAGRLIPDKGFDKILRAFALVVDQYPMAQLNIAGDGPDLLRLKALAVALGINANVSFLGWLSEELVRDQLFESRVFILLSSKPGERLPNVVKEAMAAGCISISSPSPGIDELVAHREDGFVIKADAASEVLEAVSFGFNSDRAEQMSQLAIEKIEKGFDVRNAADAYINCWVKVTTGEMDAK
uniref:glycosyltransferase family 4 protein n=1 Tax=Pseudomonas laurentiana TaxID=2364649 RepID=UPI0029C8F87D|nr:glycosyltransferase family 4 protein [Pseudomonas laurentiana]